MKTFTVSNLHTGASNTVKLIKETKCYYVVSVEFGANNMMLEERFHKSTMVKDNLMLSIGTFEPTTPTVNKTGALDKLMTTKTETTTETKQNGVSLGQFTSPVNGELIEFIALFKGNKKTGDMIQLSVLPVDGDIADNTVGRASICGTCPHVALGSCYAYDQGLFSMMKAFRAGKYEHMIMSDFLAIAKGRKIRFGRFGDISLLPFEIVNTIANNCQGFTGYTNQWRSKHYDSRFNALFMISTLGTKDSKQAAKKHPNARQFKVINTKVDYVNDATKNTITCPSENGFNCNECLLCDGSNAKVASVNIEIKAHGLDYKSKRINRMLNSDRIAFAAL